MNRRSKPLVLPTWCWRRWIVAGQENLWIERLQNVADVSWVLTEKPQRSRLLIEAYSKRQAAVEALGRDFGGQTRLIKVEEWIGSQSAPPTRIGSQLEIVHAPDTKPRTCQRQLHIPHGVAFGSGDHATTYMLLRALVDREDWKGTTVLDLGTGSGVLALTARLLGARKILATDFDAEAARTAKQNEALNFPTPLIRWQCADVKKLRPKRGYDLVLANLFSGILGEAAPQIAGSVAPGGELWLSGVLRSQQREVIAAFCGQKLKLVRVVSRGKWVMLQWRS